MSTSPETETAGGRRKYAYRFLRNSATRACQVALSISRSIRRSISGPVRKLLSNKVLRGTFKAALSGAVVGALTLGGLRALTVLVPPGTAGVRQAIWGTAGGAAAKDLAPGLHFAPRGWSRVHELDARLQFARFGFQSEGATLPALEVRTPDGSTCKVHIAVLYRLRPGAANAVVAAGLKSAWQARVEARLTDVLADAFSRIPSAELMQPEALEVAASRARTSLEAALEALHAEPLRVLVSGVWFSAPFEAELRREQLEGQAIRTDAALARRTRVNTENALAAHRLEREERALEWELDREVTELTVAYEERLATQRRDRKQRIDSRKLEAEQLYHGLLAEGELALARTAALREELLGEALQGPGGQHVIAHELAQGLELAHIELDPAELESGILDLDRWVTLMLSPE